MIIENKCRRDVLRLGARSLLGAAACAALPASALAAPVTHPSNTRTQARPGDRARFKSIDEALMQGVSNATAAGIVALAADSRSVIYEGTYGKRDLAGTSGMTPDTVFWLLSMTKAITATACMQLVEQGKVKLDLPGWHPLLVNVIVTASIVAGLTWVVMLIDLDRP